MKPCSRCVQIGLGSAEGATAAILVPGGYEQTHKGDRNQPENDAAEKGFDHRKQPEQEARHNCFTFGTRPWVQPLICDRRALR